MRFPLCSDFWDTQYIVFLNIKQFEISKWENTVNKKIKKRKSLLLFSFGYCFHYCLKGNRFHHWIQYYDKKKNVIFSPIYCILIPHFLNDLIIISFFPLPTHQFFTCVHTWASIGIFLRPVVKSSCCLHYWYLWHIGRRL